MPAGTSAGGPSSVILASSLPSGDASAALSSALHAPAHLHPLRPSPSQPQSQPQTQPLQLQLQHLPPGVSYTIVDAHSLTPSAPTSSLFLSPAGPSFAAAPPPFHPPASAAALPLPPAAGAAAGAGAAGAAGAPSAREPHLPADACPTLYIDNLPADCSKREAARECK